MSQISQSVSPSVRHQLMLKSPRKADPQAPVRTSPGYRWFVSLTGSSAIWKVLQSSLEPSLLRNELAPRTEMS